MEEREEVVVWLRRNFNFLIFPVGRIKGLLSRSQIFFLFFVGALF